MWEVATSTDFLSANYDCVLASATGNEKCVKDIQDETTALRATVQDQCSSVKQLLKDLNELGHYGSYQNGEILGLAYSSTAKLTALANELAVELGVPVLQASDVLAMHRRPVKDNAEVVVLTRFVWRY